MRGQGLSRQLLHLKRRIESTQDLSIGRGPLLSVRHQPQAKSIRSLGERKEFSEKAGREVGRRIFRK